MIRVLVIGEQGKTHLQILRKIARGSLSLFSENHALPLLDTIQFDDIVFGLFPRSGFSLAMAYGFWAKNSAGDVIDMVMQALEVNSFTVCSNYLL